MQNVVYSLKAGLVCIHVLYFSYEHAKHVNCASIQLKPINWLCIELCKLNRKWFEFPVTNRNPKYRAVWLCGSLTECSDMYIRSSFDNINLQSVLILSQRNFRLMTNWWLCKWVIKTFTSMYIYIIYKLDKWSYAKFCLPHLYLTDLGHSGARKVSKSRGCILSGSRLLCSCLWCECSKIIWDTSELAWRVSQTGLLKFSVLASLFILRISCHIS